MKKLALLIGLFSIMVFFGSANATTYTCGTCAACQSIIQNNFTNGDTLLLNASFNATAEVTECFSSHPAFPFGIANTTTWQPYNNITIDCQGHTVDGLDVAADNGIALGTYVIDAQANNVTVKNCRFNSFASGLKSQNINDLKIINVTFYNSGNAGAIFLRCGGGFALDNILIQNVNMIPPEGNGIYLTYYNECNITNLTVTGTSISGSPNYGITSDFPCTDFINGLFYNNLFNNTANLNIHGGNCGSWNTTTTTATNIVGGPQKGGNFWAAPDGSGYSQTCDNLNNDSFCDSPYALDGSNTDFLPLSLNYSEENVSELIINWETPANNSIVNANSIGWSVNLSEPPASCLLSVNGNTNVSMSIQGSRCTYTSTGLANLTTYCGKVFASNDESNVSSTQCATILLSAIPHAPLINNLGQFSVVAGIIMGAGLLLFLLDAFLGSASLLKDPKNLITLFVGALVIASVITIFFV